MSWNSFIPIAAIRRLMLACAHAREMHKHTIDRWIEEVDGKKSACLGRNLNLYSFTQIKIQKREDNPLGLNLGNNDCAQSS